MNKVGEFLLARAIAVLGNCLKKTLIRRPSQFLEPVPLITALITVLSLLLSCSLNCAEPAESSQLAFEVRFAPSVGSVPASGRLFVILSRAGSPEPRTAVGRAGRGAPQTFARDLTDVRPVMAAMIDESAFGYPRTNLSQVPAGDYSFQALFSANRDLNFPNAPGNLYSEPQRAHVDPANRTTFHVELTRKIPSEELPRDTAQIYKAVRYAPPVS